MKETRLVTPLESRIILAVQEYQYLRVDQLVTLLGYAASSTNYVRSIGKSLVSRGFLDAIRQPRTTPLGSLPIVYVLGTDGYTYCRRLGLEVKYLSPVERARSFLFLDHTLAVNTVLISLVGLCRSVSGLQLLEVKHEYQLKTSPLFVEVESRRMGIVADLWFLVGLPDSSRMAYLVELDRATSDRAHMQEKIGSYACLLTNERFFAGYKKVFATDVLSSIVFLVDGGQDRVDTLKRWARDELTRTKKLGLSDMFLFGLLPPLPIDGRQVFLSPQFSSIGSGSPVPLIEL